MPPYMHTIFQSLQSVIAPDRFTSCSPTAILGPPEFPCAHIFSPSPCPSPFIWNQHRYYGSFLHSFSLTLTASGCLGLLSSTLNYPQLPVFLLLALHHEWDWRKSHTIAAEWHPQFVVLDLGAALGANWSSCSVFFCEISLTFSETTIANTFLSFKAVILPLPSSLSVGNLLSRFTQPVEIITENAFTVASW